jgi:hypothetical protein
LPQQREEASAGAQAGEEAVKGGKGRVGILHAGELVDDHRDERVEIFPRLFPAQRPVESTVPAIRRRGHGARLPEAHFRKPIQRLAIALRCRKGKVLPLGEHRGRAFEQPDIVPLHGTQMGKQGLGKFVPVAEAEKAGEFAEHGRIGRQRVRLLVGLHLQAVFDPAQELVSRREFVARGGIDPAAGGENGERCDSRAPTQFAVPAAGNELLRLHEKFDLADAATAKLDVVTLDRDLAMTPVGMDLLLHRVDVGDRRVVQVFAPDERREVADELLAGGKVAGTGPRFDQRRSLPVLSPAFVVVERCVGGDRDLCRGRIGAKPQVDAKDVAIGRALLEEFHQLARQPHVERPRLDFRREPRCGRIEEDHEIDVARVVQLVAPHLAHRQQDEA